MKWTRTESQSEAILGTQKNEPSYGKHVSHAEETALMCVAVQIVTLVTYRGA